MKKFYAAFILIILAAAGLVFLFRAGWHPLALVNSRLVWAWQFEKEYQSALKYYDKLSSVYKLPKPEGDIKLAVLDKLIEKIIISESLKDIFGEEGQVLVSQKVSTSLKNTNLEAAVSSLLSIDFKDFQEMVLIPQAEKEIIEEKLKSESRDFSNWLKNKKNQAKVYLFTNEFNWIKGGINRK